MALTLQEQIAVDATSGGVFFQGNGQGFDESITHYPAGNLSAGAAVRAIVDRDNEEAGGVGDGEGPRVDTERGVKHRRNAVLTLPIAVTVTEPSGKGASGSSVFEFSGSRWKTVRILARDTDTQDVLVTRLNKHVDRRVARP